MGWKKKLYLLFYDIVKKILSYEFEIQLFLDINSDK